MTLDQKDFRICGEKFGGFEEEQRELGFKNNKKYKGIKMQAWYLVNPSTTLVTHP